MGMKVKELREALSKFPEDMEVMTQKTEYFGNVGHVFFVRQDSYGSLGADVPCVLLTDEGDDSDEEESEPQEREDNK